MNDNIIKNMSVELNIKESQVRNVLKLLSEDNTIPFIARYRKEMTGNLNEDEIRSINEVYEYEVNLLKRKEDVIRLIDEKGLLTEELKKDIMACNKLVSVEDLYRPFKEKKKTKATDAIENGLEGLAKIIMSCPLKGSLESISVRFIGDKVKTIDEAVEGAKYIIAEWISDDAKTRNWIRNYIFNTAFIITKRGKGQDELKVYENYYNFKEKLKYIKSHRYLAINRAEKEKVIIVNIEEDKDFIINKLKEKYIKNNNSFALDIISDAIKDSYKRLIYPSIVRDIRNELFLRSEDDAIKVFASNLESLILTPPMKEKVVLSIDPAFRTGCKFCILDKIGNPLHIGVIYPHEPHNKIEESKKIINELIKKFNVDIIAIGNGTASRETEAFVVSVIKEIDREVQYIIVNEAGASVYSASKLAKSEFPNLQVEQRSAISIGRRLIDPLSELVKIDPKSIGVGQYQHDVNNKKLDESLNFVVSKVVNNVGVNVNTASSSLLKYVSGLNQKAINSIIEYREKNGKIMNREEMKNIKNIGEKVYEQSIGFLRIIDGTNKLDITRVHPEMYEVTEQILNKIGYSTQNIGDELINRELKNINLSQLKNELNIDIYTLEDIIESLEKPLRDPRDEFDKPILKSDILKMEDLKVGMKLEGTVRNIVDFGIFIDVGLKNDGLAHISKLTKEYIKHPSELFNIGDIVSVYIDSIDFEKQKFSLSMLEPNI